MKTWPVLWLWVMPILGGIMTVVGVVGLAVGSASRVFGMLAGCGVAWVFVALVFRLWRRTFPKQAKTYNRFQRDERNIQIRQSAATTAFTVSLFLMLAMLFIFSIRDDWFATMVVIGAITILAVSYYLAFWIMSRKM